MRAESVDDRSFSDWRVRCVFHASGRVLKADEPHERLADLSRDHCVAERVDLLHAPRAAGYDAGDSGPLAVPEVRREDRRASFFADVSRAIDSGDGMDHSAG